MATQFFADAFGAEALYDMLEEPLGGPDVEVGLGVPRGAVITAVDMLRLGNGPNIELFTYAGVAQSDPVRPNDFGLQHICVYLDDIDAAADRLAAAGGTLLSKPGDLPGGDAGSGTDTSTHERHGAALSNSSLTHRRSPMRLERNCADGGPPQPRRATSADKDNEWKAAIGAGSGARPSRLTFILSCHRSLTFADMGSAANPRSADVYVRP